MGTEFFFVMIIVPVILWYMNCTSIKIFFLNKRELPKLDQSYLQEPQITSYLTEKG